VSLLLHFLKVLLQGSNNRRRLDPTHGADNDPADVMMIRLMILDHACWLQEDAHKNDGILIRVWLCRFETKLALQQRCPDDDRLPSLNNGWSATTPTKCPHRRIDESSAQMQLFRKSSIHTTRSRRGIVHGAAVADFLGGQQRTSMVVASNEPRQQPGGPTTTTTT
jgi:hypothetical protein